MSWTKFFDEIYVINLSKREDRLLQITEELEYYDIPFKRISAIEKSNGAEGLRDTMIEIFKEAQEKDYDNILVFEDDAKGVVGKEETDLVMSKVIQQLPPNYLMCFLGGQPSAGFTSFYSPNLLPVTKYFSTQSVMYSKQGINEIMSKDFGYPIDNWFVDTLQVIGRCYCVDPMLFTQRAGFSDIGRAEINWDVFMTPKHQQEVNKLRAGAR